MELEKGINVHGFCCKGFGWGVFDVDEDGTVYTECDNPDCPNRGVFLPEFGEVDELKVRLASL